MMSRANPHLLSHSGRRSLLFLVVFCILFLGMGSSHPWKNKAQNLPRQKPQTLFVALDGVPFSMMQKLYDSHQLEGYRSPSRVISTFPSTTTLGFTGLFKPLGAQIAPGYDARFYSYAKDQVRGSLLKAYDFEKAGYNHFFSYDRNTGFKQVVMYTAPRFALHRDLGYIKPILWNHPEKESIFFYIGPTDGAGHLDGPDAMKKIVLETLHFLKQIRSEYRTNFHQDLRIVLFSDHGFHWDDLKSIDLESFDDELKKMNLKLSENLKDEDHVIAITWGNISGGDFYATARRAPEVAKSLTQLSGVDLVFFPSQKQENCIQAFARRTGLESAMICFNASGTRFSYQPDQGDPLGYAAAIDALKKEGKLDLQQMASEQDWFEKTQLSFYPDALYRVHDAFKGLVQNPATLLLSTQEDYEIGDKLTRWGAWLRGGIIGTHGALSADSSSAFLTTTDATILLPSTLRYDQALLYFANTGL